MTNKKTTCCNSGQTSVKCDFPNKIVRQYQPLKERVAQGKAPVLIEIICERVHCVLYDYAISTVDMIVDVFGEDVEIQTVIRRGGRENGKHFLELCERAGQMLSVPAILINGEVAFTSVPHPTELKKAIEAALEKTK